jgi:peptide/nickel transport system permease protein
VFLIALVAALRPSLTTLVVGLAVLGIPNVARITRATTISFADREFVMAAKALGAGPFRILTRELLVNVMLPVMSLALVVMAALIVAEGSLSFPGLVCRRRPRAGAACSRPDGTRSTTIPTWS